MIEQCVNKKIKKRGKENVEIFKQANQKNS